MAKGLSFESFGGVIQVARQTLYDWAKAHPDFHKAKEIGHTASMLFWEKEGVEGLWTLTEREGPVTTTRTLNSTVWIFNMKNRFGWRDKQPDEEPEDPPGISATPDLEKLMKIIERARAMK